jgi:NitT/TauT family transport system permease protein
MKNGIIYILLSIILVALWQYAGSSNQTARLLLSSPSLIVQYFSENTSELLLATKTTLIEATTGLLIASIFSFGMMILCFYIPKLMDFIMPIMIVSQVIPLIVLAPFFIILLGIGISSKIAMAALISFFPIFINFGQGYKSISQNTHDLSFVLNTSKSFRIKHIYFPLALPNIITGLKISSSLSIIGAIVAEFSGAEIGLGKNLYISAIRLEPDLMMTSLLLSIIIGLMFYSLFLLLEKKLLRWQ